jgi:hypothetical protein
MSAARPFLLAGAMFGWEAARINLYCRHFAGTGAWQTRKVMFS